MVFLEYQIMMTLPLVALDCITTQGTEGCESYLTMEKLSFRKKARFSWNHFTNQEILKEPGGFAIGHNRYSTTGETSIRNISLFLLIYISGLSVAHNGNLTNALLLKSLVEDGAILEHERY